MDYRELKAKANQIRYGQSINYKKYLGYKAIYDEEIKKIVAYSNENHLNPTNILEKMNLKVFEMNLDLSVDNSVYGDLLIYDQVSEIDGLVKVVPALYKEMNEAMRCSQISIYTIEEIKDEMVVLKDVYSKKTIEIIEPNLNMTTDYLLMRIITYRDLSFQSGLVLNLPVSYKSFIRKNKTLFTRTYRGKGLIEFFNAYKTLQVKK